MWSTALNLEIRIIASNLVAEVHIGEELAHESVNLPQLWAITCSK
jgi:hypothetical protein